jgi:hypothetical protein
MLKLDCCPNHFDSEDVLGSHDLNYKYQKGPEFGSALN